MKTVGRVQDLSPVVEEKKVEEPKPKKTTKKQK